MDENKDKMYDLQISEFKFIIEKYILKLLGMTKRNVDNVTEKDKIEDSKTIFYSNNFIYFKQSKHSKICCKVSAGSWYSNMNFQREIIILKKILEYAPYGLSENENNYINQNQKELSYEYALQFGLCSALLEKENDKVHKLINKLEEWSCKTYEGKKVPFAFVIDSQPPKPDDKIDYLEFLDLDFSATITDGITSIIELDSNCKLKTYSSICSNEGIKGAEYNDKIMPLRFAQILSNYIVGNKIGIFLLVTGDIILAKSSELLYVKRNNKWTNFSSDRYINTLLETAKFENNNEITTIFKQIYATTLDVSFSHSGGIIAVTNYTDLNSSGIINFMDDLYSSQKDDKENLFKKYIDLYMTRMKITAISKEKKKSLFNEFEKMYIKRQMIKKLLNMTDDNKVLFSSIDRKLRAELCGLDGATILDLNGYVIAFGAIIQNNSGSSGGGRGAAASRLSDFSGFATKISTDGYIELYRQGEVCYQIK